MNSCYAGPDDFCTEELCFCDSAAVVAGTGPSASGCTDDGAAGDATDDAVGLPMLLLKQGAEARVMLGRFLGRPAVIKERFSKKYRHPALDAQLTKDRMKSELRCLLRCRTYGLAVPTPYFIDPIRSRIYMEYLHPACTLREHIRKAEKCATSRDVCGHVTLEDALLGQLESVAQVVGGMLATLHKNNLVHGDLTSSNMMVKTTSDPSATPDIYLIDFGLSHVTQMAEDKGVDLYVLERALLATHPSSGKFFERILTVYADNWPKKASSSAVLKKLDDIRLRGRKREMIG